MRNPLLALAAMMGLPRSAEAQSQEELRALAEHEQALEQARRNVVSLPPTDDEREQARRLAEQYRLEAIERNRRPSYHWRKTHFGGVDWDNMFRDDASRVQKAVAERARKIAKRERDELRSRVGKVLAHAFVCDTRVADRLMDEFDAYTLRRVAFGDGQPRWLRTWAPHALAFDIFGAAHHLDREIYEAERATALTSVA